LSPRVEGNSFGFATEEQKEISFVMRSWAVGLCKKEGGRKCFWLTNPLGEEERCRFKSRVIFRREGVSLHLVGAERGRLSGGGKASSLPGGKVISTKLKKEGILPLIDRPCLPSWGGEMKSTEMHFSSSLEFSLGKGVLLRERYPAVFLLRKKKGGDSSVRGLRGQNPSLFERKN